MRVGRLLWSLALIASGAAAADDPICADRPGKSTPTCTVAPRHWQVETGLADWSLQKAADERETGLVVGETMLRLGLTSRSEIQVDVTPWQRTSEHAGGVRNHASGVGDVNILYLHRLTTDAAPVQVAILPAVKIPTAKHALDNGKLEAGLLLPVDYQIGKSPFSLNLTPELDWAADADGRGHHAAMVQVASLGWQASERFSVSAELWGQWDWDPSGVVRQASADASVAYVLTKDVQIDGGANFGLNRATPNVELYAGIAKRF
jgi:hypothetical protein